MEFVPRSQNRKNASPRVAPNMPEEGKSFIFTVESSNSNQDFVPCYIMKYKCKFGYIILFRYTEAKHTLTIFYLFHSVLLTLFTRRIARKSIAATVEKRSPKDEKSYRFLMKVSWSF